MLRSLIIKKRAIRFLEWFAFLPGKILWQLAEFNSRIQIVVTALFRWTTLLDANFIDAHYHLGLMYTRQRRWQEALASYRKILSASHMPSLTIYHHEGEALLRLGRLDESIASCENGIELNPNFSWTYHILGEAYLKKRNWENAADAFERATALNPNFCWSHYGLGEALFRQGRYEESIPALRRSIELNAAFGWAYQILGDALTEVGKEVDAIHSFQTACRIKISQSHPHFEWPRHIEHRHRPDFLIIGEQKCGTTFLFNYLTKHPKILPGIKKETHFWSENYDKSIDWYLAHFPPTLNKQNFITGEASPSYLSS